MDIDAFPKKRFMEEEPSSRVGLCSELARLLASEIAKAEDLHREIRRVIDRLRELGHDLWSIDESDEFEVWGPNYTSPTGPGILITFSADDGVEIEWVEQ